MTAAVSSAQVSPPLLQFAELHKRYGARHALRGISFETPADARGLSIGLLGPNGAGKSTLLKVMMGLLPYQGSATVLGYEVRTQAALLRARVGYMPERELYLPGMNAVELCAYAAELSGLPASEAMQRAHATLELVGLADKRYQKVDGYSTGMKQRVKLAQALVHDPHLVLLDEPTNGLDPDGREEMLELVRSLPQRTGCSVLLSSHLLGDVEKVCERAILLHEGQMVYAGTIEALRSEGQKDVYEVRVKHGDDELQRALEARGCTVERESGLLAVRVPASEAAPAMLIFDVARAAGLQVRHLQPRKLTLEHAFVRAVKDAQGPRA